MQSEQAVHDLQGAEWLQKEHFRLQVNTYLNQIIKSLILTYWNKEAINIICCFNSLPQYIFTGFFSFICSQKGGFVWFTRCWASLVIFLFFYSIQVRLIISRFVVSKCFCCFPFIIVVCIFVISIFFLLLLSLYIFMLKR